MHVQSIVKTQNCQVEPLARSPFGRAESQPKANKAGFQGGCFEQLAKNYKKSAVQTDIIIKIARLSCFDRKKMLDFVGWLWHS